LEVAVGKYEPLGQFLKKQKQDQIRMSFKDIERIIGTKLPKSSKSHRAWWSNNPTNNVMTKEWLEAGFETENVEIEAERLVFRKREQSKMASIKPDRKSIFGCMKGMVTFVPGVDLATPTYSAAEWDEIEKEWSENWDRLMRE
jgi:hypothetical protein